jgi:glycosyltransferase involved in cell wall biosynthesis
MGGRPTRAARAEARRVPGLELFESTYKLEWMNDPWRDVDAAANWLMSLEQRFKPDVVHLNNYAHGDLPWSAPVVIVAHTCSIARWQATRTAPLPEALGEYKQRVRAGLDGARVVVAPSQAMLKSLGDHYGALNETRVIPSGRSLGLTGPAPRKEPFVLTAVSAGDELEAVEMLDRVAPRLGLPVYVAGDIDGAEVPKLAGLQSLGRLHTRTLSGWMSRAKIFVRPSRYEPFGSLPLQAAYAGCALVLGDIPSLREVWEGAALFVPPGDERAVEKAVQELAGDERRCRELSDGATQRAQSFQGCRMLASYRQLYAELVSGEVVARAPARVAVASEAR